MPTSTKISPQQAANAAGKYLSGFVTFRIPPTVEEIEYDNRSNEWFITLGFVPKGDENDFVFAIGQKEYKTFQVNAESGEVISMKIRKIS
jgi:hypothetical protein